MSRLNPPSAFWIRLLAWEYWPAWLTNIPVVFFWFYFSLRARHLFFFSAANPAIETGGVLGESKIKILDQVPKAFKPTSLFVPAELSNTDLTIKRQAQHLDFPLVAKPNVGERGLGVEKMEDVEDLEHYRSQAEVDIILQSYVDYSEEYSVLYYRFPGQEQGVITSLCHKVHLSVVGNGRDNLKTLIFASPRAYLQWPHLLARMPERMSEVPEAGEKVVLLPIGNHARGAMFLNANDQIDEQLLQTFDELHSHFEGIHLCRFDLKCRSLNDLKVGKNYQIVEVNGVMGEPAHIYDPNYPVWAAYRDLYRHWQHIFDMGRYVHQREGVPYMGFKEAWQRLMAHLRHTKSLKKSYQYA